MKDADRLGCTIHYWHRDPKNNPNDTRGYLEVHDEGLLFRCDDDYYDGEISKEEALEIAREIFAKYGA